MQNGLSNMNILTNFKDAPQGLVLVQGLYDLIPVVLFLIGSVILLRKLYSKMVKGCYCLLSAGSIMVFCAGVLKAFHKIIMGCFQVDYIILDKQFTPTQSIGFLLLFVSMIGMFTAHNTEHLPKEKTMVVALPALLLLLAEGATQYGDSGLEAFTNLWPFLSLMIIGAAGFLIMLCIIAFKMHKVVDAIFFILSTILMVCMGYLSTNRTFEGAWMQITCNALYQGCFLVGCILLKRHGLETAKLFKDK